MDATVHPGSGGGSGDDVTAESPTASTVERAPPREAPYPSDWPRHARYLVRDLLGRGGQGVVYDAHDRELDRRVALKTIQPRLASPAAVADFVDEARAAARLTHPGIVPVHDVGQLEDGRPFLVMKLFEGRSLGDVLAALAEEARTGAEGAAHETWSLVRLVQVVQQVAHALQAAHESRVLHRDVKPSNVMLGAHGEVVLVDWGLAKRTGRDQLASADAIVRGTAPYMSPEHLNAEPLDARSDVYALGVVLYQALALRLPFQAASDVAYVARALHEDAPPPHEVAGARAVPRQLADLAMAAIARDRSARLPSASALAEGLQVFLEGVADGARREKAARAHLERARAARARHAVVTDAAQRLEREVERLQGIHRSWEPLATKALLLEASRELEGASLETWTTFLDTATELNAALAHVPDDPAVRSELVDLFWPRFVEAEHARRELEALTYRRLVETFDDGRHAIELAGDGSLEVRVAPHDARLVLHAQVERGLVLEDGPARELRAGERLALPMGSYVVVASAPGRETVRAPVAITRCEDATLRLELPPAGSVPAGFVLVPGCAAWLGGDPQVVPARPLRHATVASFAIAIFPVTFGEYCAFLAELADDEVERCVPRTGPEGALCTRRADGTWEPLAAIPVTKHFAESYGAEARSRVAACGVDRACADRYAAWASVKLGTTCRLPTGDEWELAARGVDRRPWPWGHRFDAVLCHNAASFADEPDIAPVGTFATDQSVYGVRDLGGGVVEWTSSWRDRDRRLVEIRGGSWMTGPAIARAARIGMASPEDRHSHLGFRLACGLRVP